MLRVTATGFTRVGRASAHDRETAIREVAAGKRGRFVAVPARALTDFDAEGRP